MLLTEEEAKTKRCQEAYAASPGAVRDPVTEYVVESVPASITTAYACGGTSIASASRPATAPIFCLGSGCMAWRWRVERLGYCGKAGAAL